MLKQVVLWLVVLQMSTFFELSVNAQDNSEAVFRAGAAMSNITPPLGEMIVGSWKPTPATHVHDELYSRCLVLDDGSTRLAIVLCDNVGIPREVFDEAKRRIEETTEIPGSHVLLASTHTHSATTARGPSKVIWEDELTEYQKFLAQRITDGVRRAVNNLEPAQIGWGRVDEPSEVFNRRWFVHNPQLLSNPFGGIDQVRMNPPRGNKSLDRPAGPTDPEVSFITVRSRSKRPIALLANYSLHYVGNVPRGEVSADYFGYFARAIEFKLDAQGQQPAFVGILSNGTSGDINNIDFTKASSEARRYEPYEKMQEVAEKVASRVHEAHAAVEYHDWVALSAAFQELELEVRQPSKEMQEYLAAYAQLKADEAQSAHRYTGIYAERIAKLENAPDAIKIPLQVLKLGDLGIAAIPFETFVEIGLRLKDNAPTEHLFTVELANGSFGYLPTPEQHRLGGYETWLGTNFVEYEASNKIETTILEMLETLDAESQ